MKISYPRRVNHYTIVDDETITWGQLHYKKSIIKSRNQLRIDDREGRVHLTYRVQFDGTNEG